VAAPAGTGIVHYAWPEGLAAVIEGAARRRAALFGPRGWQVGDPLLLLPDGPPRDAETAWIPLPAWLVEQLPSLELLGSGLHTDFIRVHRLVERLRADGAEAVVFVLGRAPAAVAVAGGRVTLIEPADADATTLESVLTAAAGWIVVFSGAVTVRAAAPAPAPTQVVVEEPKAPVEPVVEVETPAAGVMKLAPEVTKPTAGDARAAPGVSEERYLVSPAAAASLPSDVAAELAALVGHASGDVVALLDGSRTAAEIAQITGLRAEQVSAVVRTLVAHKLAFRYVSRARRPTGAQTPG
jgi:hypothetical protein